MIEIKKGREPGELLRYRHQAGASYEAMDKDIKEVLLARLLQEQGHICAYCMRKIPEKRNLPSGVSPVTIEHWFPRNPDNNEDIGQGLDYKNMYAVCSGNRGCGSKAGLTCDASRANKPLKVNPCDYNTIRQITYTPSGRIQSTDHDINDDLDNKLNLNSERISLPENRKQVLQALIDDVQKNHSTGDISLYCERKLNQIKKCQDPKIPFVGIMIWWLERHIKNN